MSAASKMARSRAAVTVMATSCPGPSDRKAAAGGAAAGDRRLDRAPPASGPGAVRPAGRGLAGNPASAEGDRTMTQVAATPGSHEFSYERVFQAPPELVYRAHTEADIVKRWWGGRYEMVVDTLEARPGGTWRYRNKDEDGSEYGFRGVFHDVVPNERIV